MDRDCIVLSSYTPCLFYWMISFGVEKKREKSRNVCCFLIPGLKLKLDFQLNNEGKGHWRRRKYVIPICGSCLEDRCILQKGGFLVKLWRSYWQNYWFLTNTMWPCNVSHHFTEQAKVSNVTQICYCIRHSVFYFFIAGKIMLCFSVLFPFSYGYMTVFPYVLLGGVRHLVLDGRTFYFIGEWTASSLGGDLLRDRLCPLLYPNTEYCAFYKLAFQLIDSTVDIC